MSQQIPPPVPSPPPLPADLSYQGNAPVMVDRDAEHLRILMICWYVLSALVALGGFGGAFYIFFGLMFVHSPAAFGPGPPPPPGMGWILVGLGGAFMLFFWTCAILGFFAARGLQKRKWINICYVAAALACVQIPLGTLLGIFTFIVLARPPVRESFNRQSPP